MTQKLLVIVVAFATASAAFAQSEAVSTPKTMLGFLPPGTHLAVTSVEGTTSVILRTYSPENYTIARDLAKQLGHSLRSASSVAESNASVSKALEQYVSRLEISNESRDRIMIMPFSRTSFATVVTTGEDFLLLELDGEQKKKRVIPKASIGTIYLDENPVKFIDPAARLRSDKKR